MAKRKDTRGENLSLTKLNIVAKRLSILSKQKTFFHIPKPTNFKIECKLNFSNFQIEQKQNLFIVVFVNWIQRILELLLLLWYSRWFFLTNQTKKMKKLVVLKEKEKKPVTYLTTKKIRYQCQNFPMLVLKKSCNTWHENNIFY